MTALRAYFVPVDDVHGVLLAVLEAAQRSIHVSMYGFTDEELLVTLLGRYAAGVSLQVTLDQSQSRGPVEAALLAAHPLPAGTTAIGHSEKDQIIHHKVCVVDGLTVVTGSTNWSHSGEYEEDNDLLVIETPTLAATYTARLTALHHWVLAHPSVGTVDLMPDAEETSNQE